MKITYGNAPNGEPYLLTRLNDVFDRAHTLKDAGSAPITEMPEHGFNAVLLAPDPFKLPDETSIRVVLRPSRADIPRLGFSGDFVFYIGYLIAKLSPERSDGSREASGHFQLSDFDTAVAETGEAYRCRIPMGGSEVLSLYEELGKHHLVKDALEE